MQKKTTIYAIYTSEEKVSMHHLLRQLKSLKEDPNVDIWYDDSIKSGQTWKPSDKTRLYDADIFLLLVSNTFMYSEFIKQLEFKIIIDRYKSGKAKVIPLVLENCPWDIDFEAEEYTFNFNELHVLPAVNKPVSTWESAEEALAKSAAYIRSLVSSQTDTPVTIHSETNEAKQAVIIESDIQLTMPLVEETEVQQIITDERMLLDELEAKKPTEEQDIRIEEENWFHERMETTPDNIVEKEKDYMDEEPIAAPVHNTINRKRVLFAIAASALIIAGLVWFYPSNKESSDELIPASQNETIVENDTDENDTDENDTDEKGTKDRIGAGASLSNSSVEIGSKFQGGIIFDVDSNGEEGIIAHVKDTEPLIWNDAMKIHEKLGEGWRLPTLVELKKMHKTIGQGANNIGKFTDGLYWSATPYDSNQARLVRFQDGNTSFHYNSIGTFRKFPVRAVRDFNKD